MSGALPPLPNTPSLRGARLKEVQGQLYILPLELITVYHLAFIQHVKIIFWALDMTAKLNDKFTLIYPKFRKGVDSEDNIVKQQFFFTFLLS